MTVGGQVVAANTRFTHTFGCGAPETETVEGPRGKPGRTITLRPACDPVLISAAGYLPLSVPYSTV